MPERIREEQDRVWKPTDPRVAALRTTLLRLIPADRKLRRTEISHMPDLAGVSPFVVDDVVRAMRLSGLIDKSGTRFDSAYSLTEAGVAVRDLLPTGETP